MVARQTPAEALDRVARPPVMRERPASMRPRERLALGDPGSLSDTEILAILLRTGRKGSSAISLAEQVLLRVGGMAGLATASLEALTDVPGIGLAKAAQVMAAVELARRLVRSGGDPRPLVRAPSDVYALVGLEMGRQDRERFVVLLLDARHRLIRACPVSVGELTQTPAHPREVFKPAIQHSAAAVVLVHNHPSGDPTPSEEDVRLTARLAAAGELLGIEVLDHVVIGHGCHASLKELGLFHGSSAAAG